MASLRQELTTSNDNTSRPEEQTAAKERALKNLKDNVDALEKKVHELESTATANTALQQRLEQQKTTMSRLNKLIPMEKSLSNFRHQTLNKLFGRYQDDPTFDGNNDKAEGQAVYDKLQEMEDHATGLTKFRDNVWKAVRGRDYNMPTFDIDASRAERIELHGVIFDLVAMQTKAAAVCKTLATEKSFQQGTSSDLDHIVKCLETVRQDLDTVRKDKVAMEKLQSDLSQELQKLNLVDKREGVSDIKYIKAVFDQVLVRYRNIGQQLVTLKEQISTLDDDKTKLSNEKIAMSQDNTDLSANNFELNTKNTQLTNELDAKKTQLTNQVDQLTQQFGSLQVRARGLLQAIRDRESEDRSEAEGVTSYELVYQPYPWGVDINTDI